MVGPMIQPLAKSDIEDAARRICGYVRRTPTLDLGRALSDEFHLILKLEQTQVTGSFKPRGAFSVLTSVEVPTVGIVAASGGNFGIAAAYAASTLGHRATVFVPETSPRAKVGLISQYGADVHVIPGFYDDAMDAAREFEASSGAFQAHAYDHREVVAGQGTLGMELDELGGDVVLVAVGGGGLIGGIASWLRESATVVAVEPEQCSSLHAALAAGRPVEVSVGGVASSSLGARRVGDHPWAARHWIDESVIVGEREIVEAQRWLWRIARIAVEPAAATTVAALASGAMVPPSGARVVAVLSGGNVDPATLV